MNRLLEITLQEDSMRVVTLLHNRKHKEFIEESAKKNLDKYINYIKIFISNTEKSPFNIAQVLTIIRLYSLITTNSVIQLFYQQIDLIEISKHLKNSNISTLHSFIKTIYSYFRIIDSNAELDKLIIDIIDEIEWDVIVEKINYNLRNRLYKATLTNYTTESTESMVGVISSTCRSVFNLSGLIEDENMKESINKRISKSFSNIDYCIIGNLWHPSYSS